MTDAKPTAAADTNFLVVIKDHNPVLALTVEKDRDALIAHIEKEVQERTFDLTTVAGRDECRSFAAKITRTKTTLDKTATTLTEEWRQKTKAVNDARRQLVDRLAALAEEARKPLTEWEDAEEKRVLKVETALRMLTAAAVVEIDAHAVDVEAKITEVEAVELDEETYQGALPAAEKAKSNTLDVLRAALERIRTAEQERAELESLRAEAARRAQEDEEREAQARRDAEARAAAEREATAAAERRQREEQQAEERRRSEEAEARAAEERQKARIESTIAHIKEVRGGLIGGEAQPYDILIYELERKVVVDESFGERRQQVEDMRQEALAYLKSGYEEEQRRQAEEREAENRRATASAAAAAREEAAARAAQAEEREHRRREAAERDAEHRQTCKREAKVAIMTAGVDEETAKNIVLMILAGEVPRVTLDFAATPAVRSSREAFDEARAAAPEAAAADGGG